jgi:cupin fold WbuC family metalloprotein
VAYFCRNKPVKLERRLISELKKVFSSCGSRNVRLCLHESPRSRAHDMIILERKGKYYPPHKHLNKGESFHLIEGRLGVFTFDAQGRISDACVLEPKSNFIYRVGENMFHAVMPLSRMVIYHEAKPGPFLGKYDSVIPAWAPDPGSPAQVEKYKNKLLKALKRCR